MRNKFDYYLLDWGYLTPRNIQKICNKISNKVDGTGVSLNEVRKFLKCTLNKPEKVIDFLLYKYNNRIVLVPNTDTYGRVYIDNIWVSSYKIKKGEKLSLLWE